MDTKKLLRDYFVFSRKDRIAVLVVVFSIAMIYLLPKLFSKTNNPYVQADANLTKAFDTLQAKADLPHNRLEDNTQSQSYAYEPSLNDRSAAKGELFRFDPNTLPPEGWKRLGLPDRTIKTLLNYRGKGGRFYKPDDVQKIWGLPAGFYDRVKGHIAITPVARSEPFLTAYKPAYEKKERKIAAIDVNEADTAALIALPGIGPKLAVRIENFRNKLGGFYSVDQLGETYGLPDSTFRAIKVYLHVNPSSVKKININTATKEELKDHPYIRWNLANAIVAYRTQHGLFKSLDELRNIVLIDEATFNKIAPYLNLN